MTVKNTQATFFASLIEQLKQSFSGSDALEPTIQSLFKLYKLSEKDLEEEFLPFSLEQIFTEGVKVMQEKEEEENSNTEFKSFISALKDRGYFKGPDGQLLDEESKAYRERFAKAKLRFKQKSDGNKQVAEDFKNQGNDFMRQKKYEDAIQSYKKAIQNDSTNAIYFANLGAAYISVQKYEDAIEAGKKSLELDPNYSKAALRIGTAYEKLKKKENALKYYRIALELDPSNSAYEDLVARLSQPVRSSAPSMPDMSQLGNMFGGGMPDMSQFGNMFGNGMPDMSSMLNNPQFMEMANNLMQNEDFKRAAEGMMSSMGVDPSSMGDQLLSFIEADDEASNERVQEMIQDARTNGVEVLQNYAHDPVIRGVLDRARAKLFPGFSGFG